jgi:hypothetical protein
MGMSHQVDKVNPEGDKCSVMTMQIYGRTLVYFGGEELIPLGEIHSFSLGVGPSE